MRTLMHRTLGTAVVASFVLVGGMQPVAAQSSGSAPITSTFIVPPVIRVGWSPDERLVFGHAADGIVRVWSVDGGVPMATLPGQQSVGPFAIVPTPDGSRAAITGPDWSTVLVEADTLEEVWRVPQGGVPSSFSSDGRYLATGRYGVARVLDAATGEILQDYEVPERSQAYLDSHPEYDGDFFFQAEFLAGDDWVLLITRDAAPRLWDRRSGEVVELDYRTGDLAAAVSADRTRFAVGGDAKWQLEGTRVWDAADFLAGAAPEPVVLRADLPRDSDETVFAFTPDGEQVVSGWTTPPRLAPEVAPSDMFVSFADVSTGEVVRRIPTGFVGGLKVSADGQRLLVGGLQTRLYDIGAAP